MTEVTIYTTPICGYCAAAKRLLTSKGVPFHEIDVMQDPSQRHEMVKKADGRQTVPQIFIGSHHVGGYDDMAMLERDGLLDGLLKEGTQP